MGKKIDNPTDKAPVDPQTSSPPAYIPYAKALKLLTDRVHATPDEMAAWVWFGPNDNGLAAYVNAHGPEEEPPPRFFYDAVDSNNDDYLAPLMSCYFLEKDIGDFQPVDRFLTGKALIDRWGDIPGIDPEAYIMSKINENRLSDFHPLFGGTRVSFPDDEASPPLEDGFFLLSDVERVEVEDFDIATITTIPKAENETPEQRKRRLHSWLEEETQLRGETGSKKRTAEREGITRQSLAEILNRHKQ